MEINETKLLIVVLLVFCIAAYAIYGPHNKKTKRYKGKKVI